MSLPAIEDIDVSTENLPIYRSSYRFHSLAWISILELDILHRLGTGLEDDPADEIAQHLLRLRIAAQCLLYRFLLLKEYCVVYIKSKHKK